MQKTERKASDMWGCEGLYGFSCLSLRDSILVIIFIIVFNPDDGFVSSKSN